MERGHDGNEDEGGSWGSSRKWESGWITEWKRGVLENYDAHYIRLSTRQIQSFWYKCLSSYYREYETKMGRNDLKSFIYTEAVSGVVGNDISARYRRKRFCSFKQGDENEDSTQKVERWR